MLTQQVKKIPAVSQQNNQNGLLQHNDFSSEGILTFQTSGTRYVQTVPTHVLFK